MKEKMLNSNHYKRHASLLTIWISVYVLILFLLLFMTLAVQETEASGIHKWEFIGLISLVWSIFFVPGILYHTVKIISIRKNMNKYKVSTGKISNIYTSHIFRTGNRHIEIISEAFDYTAHAIIHQGVFYDEVAKGVHIEFAYLEHHQNVIILKTLS